MSDEQDQIRRVLPRGRNALDRESVAASQRARIFEAMAELSAGGQYTKMTVADLVARAGVGKPTFYEHFDSKDECLVALLDESVSQMIEAIAAGLEPNASLDERIRAGITAFVDFILEDMDRSRMLLVESAFSGLAGLQRLAAAHEMLANFYFSLREDTRETNPTVPALSKVRARAIVGAINESVAPPLMLGDEEQLRGMVDELIEIVSLIATGRPNQN